MIRTSAVTDAIFTALAEAQGEIRAAEMSGDNKFDKYQYAKLDDFLHAARPVLAKHGLAVVMSAHQLIQLPDRSTKNGGSEHAVNVSVVGLLTHKSGQWIEATCVGEGQDRSDKAPYKAITGGKKYLIASLLAIPTSDEPEDEEQQTAAASWIARCKELAPKVTAKLKDNGAAVAAVRAARGSDYQTAAADLEALLKP